MFKLSKSIVLLLIVSFAFYYGCDDNPADTDDHGPGEEELITTVTLTLTDASNPSNVATVQWRDLDGPGGNNPVIGTLTLTAGTTYNGTIALLNEEESPPENITEEVEEEAEEHQFFYTAQGGIAGRVTISVTDLDSNNFPIGLQFAVTVSAGGAASGTLNVILGHYDDVVKDGVTMSPETDVDIDIPVNIQ